VAKRQPIYDVNEYLLNGTQVGVLLGWPNVTGLRPIIPTQQQPEANERGSVRPYIVYSFRTVHDPDMWWMKTDEVSYVVWGSTFDELSEVANEIISNIQSMDESAGDIMRYLNSTTVTPQYIFHWVRLLASFSPEPAVQEGGRMGWIITFRYEYSDVVGKHLA